MLGDAPGPGVTKATPFGMVMRPLRRTPASSIVADAFTCPAASIAMNMRLAMKLSSDAGVESTYVKRRKHYIRPLFALGDIRFGASMFKRRLPLAVRHGLLKLRSGAWASRKNQSILA